MNSNGRWLSLWLLWASLPLWAGKTWGPFNSRGESFRVEEVISGRGVIWGMEFLSPGQIVFTERAGKLSLLELSSGKVAAIGGLPPAKRIAHTGQGGLFDVKLHPQFARNGLIFLTYAVRVARKKYTTVLARAQLRGKRLENFQELFRAAPATSGTRHFGGRMAIGGDDLFFSVGDRGERPSAQRLGDDRGKIHRIKLDGTVPADNPFRSTAGARPSIYSYGHRNPQGLDFRPGGRELWQHEHGPRGGDEVNTIKRGANYGWPVVSFGREYWGPIAVGEGTAKPGMEQPLVHYTPSIAPCGMAFYRGKRFPRWRGHLFLGALAHTHLRHLAISGGQITGQTVLLKSLEMRVREVLDGPDGYLYLSTDEGRILRLVPVQ